MMLTKKLKINADLRTFLICFAISLLILTLSVLTELYGNGNFIAYILLAIPFLAAGYTTVEFNLDGWMLDFILILYVIAEALVVSLVITAINWFLKGPRVN